MMAAASTLNEYQVWFIGELIRLKQTRLADQFKKGWTNGVNPLGPRHLDRVTEKDPADGSVVSP